MDNSPLTRAVPQDTGWSWMVMAGGFVLNLVVLGVARTLGIFMIEFAERFSVTSTVLNSVTAVLIQAGFFLFGGFANMLGSVCGYRIILLVGAALSSVSMFGTSFCPNIYAVLVIFGVISGVGYGCTLAPTSVVVSQYFVKRRSLAVGLAVAGGSVGQLLFPFVITRLIQFYSFQGGIMIFSGLILHMIPAALLMRPLEFWQPSSRSIKLTSLVSNDERPSLTTCQQTDADIISPPSGNRRPARHQVGDMGRPESAAGERLVNDVAAVSGAPTTAATTHSTFNTTSNVDNSHKVPGFFQRLCDSRFTRSPLFILLTAAFSTAHTGTVASILFTPLYIVEVTGEKDIAVLFVSIMGASDLVGRVGGGWFGDLRLVQFNVCMAVSLAVPGLALVISALQPGYWTLLVHTVLLGTLAGTYFALVVPMVADTFGQENVPSLIGILYICMGILLVPTPTILGVLHGATGTYSNVMIVCAVLLLVAASCFLASRFLPLCVGRHDEVRTVTRGQAYTK